jgi:hypothetical protein
VIKVRILDRCEFCDVEAYIFDCEDVAMRGDTFDRYRPCEMCRGWSKGISPGLLNEGLGALRP